MDTILHNIRNLLFVSLKRHIAFNGQISIGIYRRSTVREFSSKGEKPPSAYIQYHIELFFNICTIKVADFVFQYKISYFCFECPEYRTRGPPPPICFQKQIGGDRIV